MNRRQFLYDGRNGGKKGALCGRTEAEHCPEGYRCATDCNPRPCGGKGVHHPFHRTFKCPTCGCTEARTA